MQSQGRRRLDIGSQDVDSKVENDSKTRSEEGFGFHSNIYLQWPFKNYKYSYCTVSLEFLKTHLSYVYLFIVLLSICNYSKIYKRLKRVKMCHCILTRILPPSESLRYYHKIHLSISILYTVYKSV